MSVQEWVISLDLLSVFPVSQKDVQEEKSEHS